MQEAAMMAVLNMFGGTQGIAAPTSKVVNGPEPSPDPPDAKKRFTAAIKKLQQADPDYLTTLELIAQFATEKPEQYQGFKPIVKSQLK